MRILIVDDSSEKIAAIVAIIRSISPEFQVESVVDYSSAQRSLSKNRYDLLITDLSLPMLNGGEKDPLAGRKLVLEINRTDKLISPYYIIAITQFEELLADFNDLWKVVHYSPSTVAWRKSIQDLIKHIQKSDRARASTFEKPMPTIFCEGITDKVLIEESIRIFYPAMEGKVRVHSEKGGGASWVERQIIVWAKSLQQEGGHYIKAVALLDGDEAGTLAEKEVKRIILTDSAQAQTFKVFRLSPSYAREIIPICQKGIVLPVTLEEMFSGDHWEYAERASWLERRPQPDSLLSNPKTWDSFSVTLKAHLDTLGLTRTEQLYLNRFKLQSKGDFCDYIMALPFEQRKKALKNFSWLVKDMMQYLNVK